MGPGRPRPARAGTRAAAAAAAVTLAAVAVLELVEQVASAFELRPWVNVLIVAAVALATLAASLIRQRGQRERELDSALRCWPLPRMAEVDRLRLGVFPLRRGAEGTPEAEYVGRDLDGPIRDALRDRSFVLIVGPPRAGKSRTAFEAAREADGDALVVVPRDGDSLRALLELDPPLLSQRSRVPRWGSRRAVLWLDELSRYLDALDADVLDALRDGDVPVTIVGTIRADEYRKALDATGSEAEGAKAVAAEARAFELPADDRAAELSTSGTESDPPLSRDERVAGDSTPVFRDPRVAVPAALCVAALAAIGLIALTIGIERPQPVPLAEQADDRLREAGAAVWGPVQADLHGTGQNSWLFVTAPRPAAGESARPSHELRIYDAEGEKLVERFRFRPDVPGAEFQYRDLARLGGGGGAKLVGGYGFQSEASRALLPFIVLWDADSAAYRIEALQDEPPELSRAVPRTPESERYLDSYERRIELRDDDAAISGHRVQDFWVSRDPPRIVTGVTFDPKTTSRPGRVEVRASILSFARGDLAVIPCRVVRALLGPWSRSDLWVELRDRWQARTRRCVPA